MRRSGRVRLAGWLGFVGVDHGRQLVDVSLKDAQLLLVGIAGSYNLHQSLQLGVATRTRGKHLNDRVWRLFGRRGCSRRRRRDSSRCSGHDGRRVRTASLVLGRRVRIWSSIEAAGRSGWVGSWLLVVLLRGRMLVLMLVLLLLVCKVLLCWRCMRWLRRRTWLLDVECRRLEYQRFDYQSTRPNLLHP